MATPPLLESCRRLRAFFDLSTKSPRSLAGATPFRTSPKSRAETGDLAGLYRLDYRVAISAEGGPVFDGERVYVADGGGHVRAVDWTQRRLPFERFYVWSRIHLFAWGIMDTLPKQRGFVWFFRESDGEFVTTPVVAWGRVYAASLSGSLFALDQDTGEEVWEFQAQDSFEASPSVVGDVLFAGDSGGRLYAIDAITGSRRWDVDLGSGITSTPVFAERLLYVTTRDGILYALE